MLKLNVMTKKKPDEILQKAVGYFGPAGYKLKVVEQDENHVYFEGGGGGVEVDVVSGEDRTSVDLTTREWEFQIKEFARTIK